MLRLEIITVINIKAVNQRLFAVLLCYLSSSERKAGKINQSKVNQVNQRVYNLTDEILK